MNFITVTAGENDAEKRADRVLRVFLPSLPLARIYSAMRTGLIKINGKKTAPAFRLAAGDRIQIAAALMEKENAPPAGRPRRPETPPPEYEIIFRNGHLLFINKPYDLSVQGGAGNAASVASVMAACAPPGGPSLAFTPAPLHRLDRKTTGLLAVSQSIRGARWFSEALKTGQLVKTYLGLAAGSLGETQVWQDRLLKSATAKNGGQAGFHTSAADDAGSEAITKAEPLLHGFLAGKPVTLVRYTIFTGKNHQIRLQSALHGCPLAGDSAYGHQEKSLAALAGRDFFLHALELDFPADNPVGLPVKIIARPDEIFRSLCRFCLPEYDDSPYNE